MPLSSMHFKKAAVSSPQGLVVHTIGYVHSSFLNGSYTQSLNFPPDTFWAAKMRLVSTAFLLVGWADVSNPPLRLSIMACADGELPVRVSSRVRGARGEGSNEELPAKFSARGSWGRSKFLGFYGHC